jgi:hypothetical protein
MIINITVLIGYYAVTCLRIHFIAEAEVLISRTTHIESRSPAGGRSGMAAGDAMPLY